MHISIAKSICLSLKIRFLANKDVMYKNNESSIESVAISYLYMMVKHVCATSSDSETWI